MKRPLLVAAAVPAVLIGLSVLPVGALSDDPVPTPSAEAATQPAGPAGEASNCRKTTTSGSGNTYLSWCFSDTGNIMKFESPVGQEHIRNGTFLEGYAICATGVPDAFDNASSGANFGAPSFPNANSVRRSTPAFQLDQTFSQNAVEKLVSVSMTVKNVSGSVKTNVRLSRFVDIDMNGSPSDDRWDKSVASTVALQSNMLALTARSFEVNKVSTVETFGDLADDTGCDATTPLAVPSTGDNAGRVTYSLGNINPGQSKTVIFRYSRI